MPFSFYGSIAILIYTFLLGTIVPNKFYHRESFYESSFNLIGISVYLSWCVFLLSYILNINNPLWSLVILLLLRHLLINDYVQFKYNLKEGLSYLVILAFIIGIVIPEYTFTFIKWDAVVSWNRWAEELSRNIYFPTNQPYPVLFPALWSLIYKAMSTSDYVIFSKLTILILPFLLALIIGKYLLRSLRIGITLLTLSLIMLIYPLSTEISSGYMDAPVALMILIALLQLIYTVNYKQHNFNELLVCSVLFGITSIIKQAGMFVLIIFLMWCILLFLKRKINLWKLISLSTISLFPLISFLALFLSLVNNPFGNIKKLKSLSYEVAQDGSLLSNSISQIMEFTYPALLFTILLFSFGNIFFLKKENNQLGMLIFIFSLIGFYSYAQCCSYDFRNGWWIISLLISSAICTLTSISQISFSHE